MIVLNSFIFVNNASIKRLNPEKMKDAFDVDTDGPNGSLFIFILFYSYEFRILNSEFGNVK